LWDAKFYENMLEKGADQVSFDKQPVRDFGVSIKWDKKPPGPELPPEVVRATTERYTKGYQMLTGETLDLEKIKVRSILV
jgi:phosphoribosylaminoimidazole-succinocarboxamide synthase